MTNKLDNPISYADSGVNIDHGNELVERIKPAVTATKRIGSAGDLGGFGGLFDLKACGYKDPILVSATDGVGTKLRLAIDSSIYHTVGIDLVAMCVNDLIVQGAEPLFFLDYFASGALEVEMATKVIEGIAEGCKIAGAALIGGETAEMPDMYADKDFDLAGFCVGAVERENLITGNEIGEGDRIIGVASSGVHSNGFSLVRKILANSPTCPDSLAPIAETLLEPTRIYVKPVLKVLEKNRLLGIAHITGGGITENLPRVLPKGLGARINLAAWELPAIFAWLMDQGPVVESEMLRTFNCGIGLAIVVREEDAERIIKEFLALGEQAMMIGEIIVCESGQRVQYTAGLR